ncbi:PAS domain-containing protein, partial [Acinetobacter baumannii]
ILGYTPDDLIGSRLIDHIGESAQEKFADELRAVVGTVTGKRTAFEMPAINKDGRAIDLLWSMSWSPSDNSVFCIT